VQQCGGQFLRTHRSYAIHPKYIESITNTHIKVSSYQVPLHKTYRQQILSLITTIK
jgi:DNA-binding LytR/AlgR family response regulator